MCGIAGYLHLNGSPAQESRPVVERMTDALSHRGPDAAGFFAGNDIALGHRRLSIIDLSESANQPMTDREGRYTIVFNGEIYNFRELRRELADYPFQTNGDTEVILAAYRTWGGSCVNRLAGMFAFTIWDAVDKKLFLARDRMGVKPLYYFQSSDGFFFASEIRALLASGKVPRELNPEAAHDFLRFQSVPQPATILKNVFSLPSASYMLISGGNTHIIKYWNITEPKGSDDEKAGHSAADAYKDPVRVKKCIADLLQGSVERRMISDVPLGAFLSGGIDSSAIVGLMARASAEPVNTFTIGFNEVQFDESSYAQKIASKFNTRHHEIVLSPTAFLDQLLPSLDAMDSPSGDGVNSYVVSKAIKENGITVALSGVGGDELFAGYPIFIQYIELAKRKKAWKLGSPLRHLLAGALAASPKRERYTQFLRLKQPDIAGVYPLFRQIVSPKMMRACITLEAASVFGRELRDHQADNINTLPLLSQVSAAEYLGYTRNTLLNDMDQMSMAVSLEVREPFFDHELIEFVLGIPDDQKFPAYPKKLLVESLGDLLPPEIVHRRKQGFLFPWAVWMKKELFSFCEARLQSVAQRGFVKAEGLMNYWKRFLQGDPSVRWLEIWLFVVLEYWLEKNGIE